MCRLVNTCRIATIESPLRYLQRSPSRISRDNYFLLVRTSLRKPRHVLRFPKEIPRLLFQYFRRLARKIPVKENEASPVCGKIDFHEIPLRSSANRKRTVIMSGLVRKHGSSVERKKSELNIVPMTGTIDERIDFAGCDRRHVPPTKCNLRHIVPRLRCRISRR